MSVEAPLSQQRHTGVMVSALDSGLKGRLGFEHWQGTLNCVIGQDTFPLSASLSTQVSDEALGSYEDLPFFLPLGQYCCTLASVLQ